MRKVNNLSSLVFLEIIFAIIFLFMAYLAYAFPYSMNCNWISDLGNQLLNPGGWWLFTIGCGLCGGIQAIIFAKSRKDSLKIFGAISGAAFVAVGIYSSLFFIQHSLFSSWYFICTLICIVIMSFSIFPENLSYFGFAVAILNIVFLICSIPLLEWLTFMFNLAFISAAALMY